MEGPTPPSINSKATAIKTILLTAWRNKSTNEEWENKIRKVLPRAVNGDVYDLADCLLKQALVGPVPNQLFISYLEHAVHSELVSHGAVLRSIAQQPISLRSPLSGSSAPINRTSPIVCLLDFLRSFRDQISCRGTEVECLSLCYSLNLLLQWLVKCCSHTIDQITSSHQQSSTGNPTNTNINSNNQQSSISHLNLTQYDNNLAILDLCTETINYFVTRPFTKSLLFISKIEHSKEFEKNILDNVRSIQQKLSNFHNLQSAHEKVTHLSTLLKLDVTFNSKDLHPSVVAAQQLRCLQLHRIRSAQNNATNAQSERRLHLQGASSQTLEDSTTNYALFNSLYPLIASDAVLRLARSHKHLARQIVTITNFYSAPIDMTYCELIRVCMIGLIDAGKSKLKSSWPFFTFLKLPKLLIELGRLFKQQRDDSNTNVSMVINQSSSSSDNSDQPHVSFVNDLKLAFERLCAYSPLLDEAEYKCNCDLFKCLIKELIKNEPSLVQLKSLDLRKFPARRPSSLNNNDSPWGGHMMLRTEPVVTSMLETLNSEQDPTELYAILCQQCTGISFDFTLSAAAATGRLHLFVKRLVEHNELYKVPRNDLPPKYQHAQALNFDITFLILIFIAQRYGSELIEKDQRTTFNKWYHECYNHETCYSCPKEVLKKCDDVVVSDLIKQLAHPDLQIDLKSIDWHEICFNTPKAISEILNAWTQGYISDDDMNIITERLRSRMCFLAVVASTWLQSHIKTLNEVDRAKPLTLLNNLSKASQQAKQKSQQSAESDLKNDGYHERSSLMGAVIRRIYFELVPTISSSQSNQNPSAKNGRLVQINSSQDQLEDSLDESSYHSYRDRFISTLTTQEIFHANIKQCLSRGWIDYHSLNSLNSLLKIIGGECFTNLLVDQILTSHESPNDLSRAVNITFGLFHLDIETCAFALLKDTIPNWLTSEKKQVLLSQPRAFALANLTVMTIIEVYNNLKGCAQMNDKEKKDTNIKENNKNLSLNGIKQEPDMFGNQATRTQQQIMQQKATNINDTIARLHNNVPRGAKRIKLSNDRQSEEKPINSLGSSERLEQLNEYVSDLMRLFKVIMSDKVMSQRTLFPVLFLQQTVVCAREESTVITTHLQPEILLDIINLFSSELTFELVLAISNLSSTASRKYAAKAMCKLAQVKESRMDHPQFVMSSARAPVVGVSSAAVVGAPSLPAPPRASMSKAPPSGSSPMMVG